MSDILVLLKSQDELNKIKFIMSIFLTLLLVIICIVSYVYNKYNILLFLLVLSLFGDIFEFQIGVSLKLHHFIVLLSLPKLLVYFFNSCFLKNYLKYLLLEFIIVLILGVIFGFITPFDDPYASSRLFTQTPAMRATISSIRMLLELNTIILIVYWFSSNKISLNLLIKMISIVLLINVVVAVFDFFSGYLIKDIIYPGIRVINGRFTGLSGEPKAFGRYCSFGLIFLLYFNSTKNKKLRLLAMFFSAVGVLLSLSASTVLITTVGLSIYLLSQQKIKSTIVIASLTLIAYGFLNTSVFFQTDTLMKIQTALGMLDESSLEKVRADEPAVFSRFDVFDRAALNFLYDNPKYLFFGVGPNLISTPASEYLTPTAATIYTEGINTTPGTYFLSTLSRSGLIGIILNIMFFSFVLRNIRKKSEKYFFIAFWVMSLMVGTSLFYFFNGLVLAALIKSNITQKKYLLTKYQLKKSL